MPLQCPCSGRSEPAVTLQCPCSGRSAPTVRLQFHSVHASQPARDDVSFFLCRRVRLGRARALVASPLLCTVPGAASCAQCALMCVPIGHASFDPCTLNYMKREGILAQLPASAQRSRWLVILDTKAYPRACSSSCTHKRPPPRAQHKRSA